LLTVNIFIFHIFYFQGDVIHAVIWKSMIDSFKSQIKENCIYSIKNFKVQQTTIYRPVENELKIIFVYNTKIKELIELSKKYPEFYFEFATIDLLLVRESKDKQCSGKVCCLYYFTLISMLLLMVFFQMSLVYLAACQMYNKELY
jgi:hypothetical protein